MYLDFYHLKKAPFHITPDPEFLFLSPSHKAALGALVYGIDERQHMPVETLEHLRMLSNLETSTQKLMQIVLVGQPEFDAKLNGHALRQLKQRLVIRGTISPLTDEESQDYIIYRLAKVVMMDEPIFTKGAIREIIKHAKGTPRVINVLCTNALIQGFGYRKRPISRKIIKEVIADYTGKKPQRRWRPRMALAGTTALLAALFWFSPY